MSQADAAIGMMEGAYFTSRKDILDWLNDLLCLNLTKIEQTASGAVACQIIEYIYPNSVPLHRVNWEAKSEYEFVQNYKLLQVAFTKHKVQRHVDVPRLIRAKYQDNLEFCQWLKAFFEQAAPPERANYDPEAARNKGKGGKIARQHFSSTAKQHNSKLLPSDRVAKASSSKSQRTGYSNGSKKVAQGRTIKKENKPNGITSNRVGSTVHKSTNNVGASSNAVNQSLKSKITELSNKNHALEDKVAELELTLTNMEKERDFYFGKLRDVEIMMQVHEESEHNNPKKLIKKVFKVLYATSDDLVEVDDDGNIVGFDDDDESEVIDDIIGNESASAKEHNIEEDLSGKKQHVEDSFHSLDLSDNDDDLLVY